jgi:hypothetical protein
MAFTSFEGPTFRFEALAPENGPLGEQLAAWSERAIAAGRVPCVYLTAVWCPANGKLEKALIDTRMQRALREIEAASFDIDVWGDQLTAAGFPIASVPAFFVLDAGGRPTGVSITGAAWKDDIPENMAPPLAAFFDGPRAAHAPPAPPEPMPVYRPPPTIAAYSPRPPPPAAESPWRTIALVVGIAAVVIAGAWLLVRDQDKDPDPERIREEAKEAIEPGRRPVEGE